VKPLATALLLVSSLAACGSVVQPKTDVTTPDANSNSDSDAGTGSGSDGSTLPEHRIFVTSAPIDGNMGGLVGADNLCNRLAKDAGLTGPYLAWLADETNTPASRMRHHEGLYKLVDGTVVSDGFGDLVDGTLLHAIDVDERGNPSTGTFICRGGEVWSNVDIVGDRRSVQACSDWTDASSTNTGASGNVTNSDAPWTEGECLPIGCDSMLPIYCVEQ
jgi:hypothetical protein